MGLVSRDCASGTHLLGEAAALPAVGLTSRFGYQVAGVILIVGYGCGVWRSQPRSAFPKLWTMNQGSDHPDHDREHSGAIHNDRENGARRSPSAFQASLECLPRLP